MKNLIIFVGLLSITLCFPVGSPLHKRERRRRQLGFGYGYGPIYPFYNPFLQPDNNDFTPEIYIGDNAKPSIPRPVTPGPLRLTTSMVKPVILGEPCPQTRDDCLNIDQLPVFIPSDGGLMGVDRPLSPGQSGSNNIQRAFVIVPGVLLPASEDSQVAQNTSGLKAPDPQSVTESNRKPKDC